MFILFHDYGRRRRTFVQSDEESDYYEPPTKRVKIEEDSDLELNESDWEDVFLDNIADPAPSEFSITIQQNDVDHQKKKG